MECKQCGKEVPNDAVYCPYCGRRLPPAQPVIREDERCTLKVVRADPPDEVRFVTTALADGKEFARLCGGESASVTLPEGSHTLALITFEHGRIEKELYLRHGEETEVTLRIERDRANECQTLRVSQYSEAGKEEETEPEDLDDSLRRLIKDWDKLDKATQDMIRAEYVEF